MKRARVRTSTLILVALFVGASLLYLFVRPTAGSTGSHPASASTTNH